MFSPWFYIYFGEAKIKLRLLQIIPRDPRGGIYRVNLDLIEAFINEPGFELHTALIDSRSYNGEFNFGKLQLDYSEIKGNVFQKIQQLKELANKFDIIHLHGFVPWIALALLYTNAEIVFTNHGLLGVGRKLRPHEHIKKWLAKRFLRYRVNYIFNISYYALRRMLQEYKVDPEKNSIAYNCSRWQKIMPVFNPNGKLTIGFHGRFVHFKRVDRLLKTASIVNKQLPVTVQLLGDGPLKDDYRHLSNYLNVRTEFTGYTLQPQSIIKKYDVEIIASDEEYFGLSVIESILSGNLTMVFIDGGGCTEIFGDEFPDFIAEDEADMAAKIIAFYEQSDKTAILQKLHALQHHVAKKFSLEKFKAGYLEGYMKVLSN